MIRRRCVELCLGIAFLALLPLSPAHVVDRDAPWPMLMPAEVIASEASLARLQDRANASLERMLRAGAAAE
jgi:hypothetical protein